MLLACSLQRAHSGGPAAGGRGATRARPFRHSGPDGRVPGHGPLSRHWLRHSMLNYSGNDRHCNQGRRRLLGVPPHRHRHSAQILPPTLVAWRPPLRQLSQEGALNTQLRSLRQASQSARSGVRRAARRSCPMGRQVRASDACANAGLLAVFSRRAVMTRRIGRCWMEGGSDN